MGKNVITLSLLLISISVAQAQLVITEVMSQGSTNLGGTMVVQNSDFWELTNFGDQPVDLTGYRWNDSGGGLAGADSTPFQSLVIGPGQSVIFVENDTISTEADFRAWWGASLPATTQIRFYSGNGFGNSGDGVRLWSPTATTDAETVSSVDFGAALRGHSFTYSPVTGVFGVYSTNGVNGAFKAATTDDEGSPGVTTGPVGSAAPTVQVAPASVTVYTNQNAIFTVVAAGTPAPTYRWQFNGADIPGATTSSYTVVNADAGDVGTYTVIINNVAGTATRSATLSVTERPRLAITEVSSAQSTVAPTAGHSDWWELTNLDDFTVDLYGYQFDDASRQRAAAFTITNRISIAPGESIIFVDGSTAAEFIQWWGAANLGPGLQIITYDASGLGLSATADELHVWNPGAASDDDTIASAAFGAATAGITFGYNPATETFGGLSVAGENGAFVSSESGDVGSPGTIGAEEGFEIAISRTATGLELSWSGPVGATYRVEYRDDLNPGTAWVPLTTVVSTAPVTTLPVSTTSATGQRYYQVVLLP